MACAPRELKQFMPCSGRTSLEKLRNTGKILPNSEPMTDPRYSMPVPHFIKGKTKRERVGLIHSPTSRGWWPPARYKLQSSKLGVWSVINKGKTVPASHDMGSILLSTEPAELAEQGHRRQKINMISLISITFISFILSHNTTTWTSSSPQIR